MVRHLPQSEIYWVPGSPTGIQGPLIRVQFLNLGLNQRLKICETYEKKKPLLNALNVNLNISLIRCHTS